MSKCKVCGDVKQPEKLSGQHLTSSLPEGWGAIQLSAAPGSESGATLNAVLCDKDIRTVRRFLRLS